MSIISQKLGKNEKSKVLLWILVAVFLLGPAFAFSSHRSKIYVDDSASGTQDGSSDHPYKTIGKAMDKADDDTEIHISKGFYKENIKVKDGVEIYGESKSGVVIEAEDDDDPTVIMKDDTVLDKVTVKGGSYGIEVGDGGKASIVSCIIKDNHKGGVHIKDDGTKKSKMVSLSKNEIRDNDGAGIYSGKRKLSLTENKIKDNDGDGIDIEKGSKAWIADNDIENNDKSGMKLRIDGSEIWTKHNSIQDNKREGVEVSFKGEAGIISISKTKITGNDRYGVARVQRFVTGNFGLWSKYLTFDKINTIKSNSHGNISPVITIK